MLTLWSIVTHATGVMSSPFVSVLSSVARCGMYEVNDSHLDVTIRQDKTKDSRACTRAKDNT